MTFFDIGVPVLAAVLGALLYLYAWNERRKLRISRSVKKDAPEFTRETM